MDTQAILNAAETLGAKLEAAGTAGWTLMAQQTQALGIAYMTISALGLLLMVLGPIALFKWVLTRERLDDMDEPVVTTVLAIGITLWVTLFVFSLGGFLSNIEPAFAPDLHLLKEILRAL